ncbi:MAG: hypothetical protein H0W82_10295, partial [Actinobacteria bacterium]|nr:hypothetical protein [Actinomycetota bacterium]
PVLLLGYAQIPEPSVEASVRELANAVAESRMGGVGVLEARVEVNRGGPGNPLSDEELARKFHDNAVRSLPEGARGRARGPNARPS